MARIQQLGIWRARAKRRTVGTMRFLPACTAIVLLCAAARADAQPPAARIDGVVTDSVHARPLVGALVFATPIGARGGAIRSVFSDSAGHYVIDSLAAGTYAVDFTHAFADSLALNVPPV